MTMVAAFRHDVLPGALMALMLVPAAAGRTDLAVGGLQRVGVDAALMVGAGLLVFGAKRATTTAAARSALRDLPPPCPRRPACRWSHIRGAGEGGRSPPKRPRPARVRHHGERRGVAVRLGSLSPHWGA
jgi:hypothetical protein